MAMIVSEMYDSLITGLSLKNRLSRSRQQESSTESSNETLGTANAWSRKLTFQMISLLPLLGCRTTTAPSSESRVTILSRQSTRLCARVPTDRRRDSSVPRSRSTKTMSLCRQHAEMSDAAVHHFFSHSPPPHLAIISCKVSVAGRKMMSRWSTLLKEHAQLHQTCLAMIVQQAPHRAIAQGRQGVHMGFAREELMGL